MSKHGLSSRAPRKNPSTVLSPPSAEALAPPKALPTYRELLGDLTRRVSESGFLALLLIDVSDINKVEREYGSRVYDRLMRVVRELVSDLKGKQLRERDLVALNEKAGEEFLLFLMPRSRGELVLAEDLERTRVRIESSLSRKITKEAFPYLHIRPDISVGASLVLRNPLIREERLILRGIDEARQAAKINIQQGRLQKKKTLQRVILKKEIRTLFQPIFNMREARAHGFEALVRGPKGTALESPIELFTVAKKTNLLFELDHLCRREALRAGRRLDRKYKLFINTFPFSVRDPSFQGKYLIDLFEGTELAPEQIVLEVTESLTIENYGLFVDAMKDFSNMRCLIAIDDVGAGYSGLEKIVRLRPDYVKLDMSIVRGIDTSPLKQQMLRSVQDIADNIDARLIAEGVETRGELDTVLAIGVDYVQGHFLAKPSAAFQTAPTPAVKV
ncbi:MAG: EAL domain-containing protein [Acidobacteriota bacterium]